MVGGEAGCVERARPVLEAVGSDVRHVGPSGAGAAVKLANQLMMFSALAGAYEALEFARAYDVEEQTVLDAVRHEHRRLVGGAQLGLLRGRRAGL